MASGIYSRVNPNAATNTTLISNTQVATGKVAVVTVNITNTGASQAKIRLQLQATSTPAAGEYLEYNTLINASGVLERTGILVPAGTYLVGYSDVAGVNFVTYGLE